MEAIKKKINELTWSGNNEAFDNNHFFFGFVVLEFFFIKKMLSLV
jgi:hypothetical protein